MLGLYAYFVLAFRPGGDAVWPQEIVALCATCDTKPTANSISLTYLISGQDGDFPLNQLYSFHITR
jgi:hypothetical protein